MKHKNSHLLVGYWSRLRRGRAVPFQGDIDPRDIKRLLSYVFILDCENPARPVYRLAGTALCERFGFELLRVPLSSNALIPCFNNFSAFLGPPRLTTLNFFPRCLL